MNGAQVNLHCAFDFVIPKRFIKMFKPYQRPPLQQYQLFVMLFCAIILTSDLVCGKYLVFLPAYFVDVIASYIFRNTILFCYFIHFFCYEMLRYRINASQCVILCVVFLCWNFVPKISQNQCVAYRNKRSMSVTSLSWQFLVAYLTKKSHGM